jgi:hypothetical protein
VDVDDGARTGEIKDKHEQFQEQGSSARAEAPRGLRSAWVVGVWRMTLRVNRNARLEPGAPITKKGLHQQAFETPNEQS